MKICWDNLENVRYNPKTGNFRKSGKSDPKEGDTYVYREYCGNCGEPYLVKASRNTDYCSIACGQTGNKNHAYKGGFKTKDLASYNTFAHQLIPIEKVRPAMKNGLKILQVKCYNSTCKKWHFPSYSHTIDRIRAIKGLRGNRNHNFYCSNECKFSCEVFGQIKWPKNNKPYYNYEHASTHELNIWSKEVLKRAAYICEICNKKAEHAHHILPKSTHPEFALDIDNGMAVCKNCHMKNLHTGKCSSTALSNIKKC